MPDHQKKRIASLGGKAAHKAGTAHTWDAKVGGGGRQVGRQGVTRRTGEAPGHHPMTLALLLAFGVWLGGKVFR
jgi:hypothetical protein